jgi:acyl carrier protein
MTERTKTTSIEIVMAAVASVAPEVEDELASIDHTADLFEFLGLDSMDHLNVMTEIAERTGIEIPERDYGRLRSLDALADRIVS